MKTALTKFILIPLLLFTFANTIHAQSTNSNANDKFFWLNAGLGPNTFGEEGLSLGVNMNATYQFSRHMFSLRLNGCSEFFTENKITEYGLLYGYALASSHILLSLGAGIAVVSGSISKGLFAEEEPEEIGPTVGLPLEVHLCWRAFRFLGIGLYGYANMNPEESFAGVTLNLQIGKLR